MEIISWNVNGLRARIKAGFEDFIKKTNPDIICLQEVRATAEQLPRNFLSDYTGYQSIHEKAGYAGSSIFIKRNLNLPYKIEYNFDGGELGRICVAHFPDFSIASIYAPNVGSDLSKINKRVEWENNFLNYLSKQDKHFILIGDMNVAPQAIDTNSSGKAGTTPEERKAFFNKIKMGYIDVFRKLNPETVDYTWHSNRFKNSKKGMRIDLCLTNNINLITDFNHIKENCGSDHFPLYLKTI